MVQVEFVTYRDRHSEIRAIRIAVFQQEQQVPPDLEFDGEDETATHLLASWEGEPAGTARLRWLDCDRVKLERLAVLKSARGKGIGSQLIRHALARASVRGANTVIANVQIRARQLYERLGFVAQGDCFDEASIPHIKMTRTLEGEL